MAVETYKCPSCDGAVIFDPATQQFQCEYCRSRFTRQELEQYEPARQTETQADSTPQEKSATQHEPTMASKDADQTMVYSCPSCGAEVVTDETTAATECYYCHNPVVLSGRLDGAFKPDSVIPFAIQKGQAVEAFLEWVGKKRFVPKAFFSKKQIDRITGVYYPYWTLDCKLDVSLDAHASTVRIWQAGEIEYTETKHYQLRRAGALDFHELTKNALKKADHMLAEGVQPFTAQDMKPFTAAYLSGFQAEKRDIGSTELREQTVQELHNYSRAMLMDTVSGYTAVTPGEMCANLTGENWRYVLLPVWVLTYRAANKKLYYYAMNGQTGKVCGILPLDLRRLFALFAGVSLPLFLLLLVGGYFFL